MGDSKKKQSAAERCRSRFRHDIRTSFNVLIGYSEICLEDFDSKDTSSLTYMNQFLGETRSAFRDTEYAIDRSDLASEELFKVEIGNWLKLKLIPLIQNLGVIRSRFESQNLQNDNWKNLDNGLKRLAVQCLYPFEESNFGKKGTLQKTESEPQNTIGKILIVDDNWDNLVVLRHKLERLKCDVSAMTSPLLALHLLSEIPFDVILVDLEMPEMSGLDFLKAIISNPSTKDIPVLIVTASDDKTILSQCINSGAIDFLPKPVESSILKARVLSCLERKESRDRELKISHELSLEKARVDELLSMILPQETVIELKETGVVLPRKFSNVSVLFCDIVNFTPYCESHAPEEIISNLHSLFSEFDAICEIYGMQKIKTFGDSYMAAGSLLKSLSDPLFTAIQAGFAMIDAAAVHSSGWKVRVGVHVGDVIAGIVGTRQYLFDLWGDTVNIASRLEGAGEPMCVTLLENLISERSSSYSTEKLGVVELKGKGDCKIASLSRISSRVGDT